jgi:hypothetical protein
MNRFSRAAAGFLVFTVLSSASAWFNIQAVRWSYQNRRLRLRLEDLKKTQQSLDRRLHESLSLERLDQTGRDRFHLAVPLPNQIVLLPDDGRKAG